MGSVIILNQNFLKQTAGVKSLLCELKSDLDRFDAEHKDTAERIANLNRIRSEIFAYFNAHYAALWSIAKYFSPEEYKAHQEFLRKELNPLLSDPEVNRHIYDKPFGYAGDYVIMNYVYDYQGEKYLGKTSYEMILNNYACNVPTLKSNPVRLEFIISKIRGMMSPDKKLRVASIACGPARELFEILKDGKFKGALDLICFDLEPKAIEHIKQELLKIPQEKKTNVNVRLMTENVLNIIRRQGLREEMGKQDLVYAIGLYDYLKDNLAKKLTAALFSLLDPGGKLIVVNLALEPCVYRAYYEMIGEWYMFHRKKSEMEKWAEGLPHLKSVRFEEPEGGGAYHYMVLEKEPKCA